jgi:hypothetical protein
MKLPAIRGWSKVISASAETSIRITTNQIRMTTNKGRR